MKKIQYIQELDFIHVMSIFQIFAIISYIYVYVYIYLKKIRNQSDKTNQHIKKYYMGLHKFETF